MAVSYLLERRLEISGLEACSLKRHASACVFVSYVLRNG